MQRSIDSIKKSNQIQDVLIRLLLEHLMQQRPSSYQTLNGMKKSSRKSYVSNTVKLLINDQVWN